MSCLRLSSSLFCRRDSRNTPGDLVVALLSLWLIGLSLGGCEQEPGSESKQGVASVEGASKHPQAVAMAQEEVAGGPSSEQTPKVNMGRARSSLPKARAMPKGRFFGLEPIQAEADHRPFAFSVGPKPPPKVGEVVSLPIPPPKAPAEGPAPLLAPEPLKVMRGSPKGKVSLVSGVTAQFNQPMVPLTSLSQLSGRPVPLQIRPAVPVEPRWLGTRTVALESKRRLPFSTLYTVSVPVGARSVTGSSLQEGVSWTFETPRLRCLSQLPVGKQVRPDALIALFFDQEVDPKALAPHIRLRAEGGASVPLAVVSSARWLKLKRIQQRLSVANPKRTLVLRPKRRLQRDTGYMIEISKGAPSAEGSLTTRKAYKRTFRTYPKLSVQKVSCGWSGDQKGCREGAPIHVVTSTRLSDDQDLKALIELKPAVANLEVDLRGSGLRLRGDFLASTRYRLSISRQLRDDFGQVLGKAWQGTLSYRDGEPVLQLPSTSPVVLEAARPIELSARLRNIDEIEVKIVEVKEDLWADAYRQVGRRWSQRKTSPIEKLLSKAPDSRVLTRTLKSKLSKNVLGRLALPLKEALAGRKDGVFAISLAADWPNRNLWEWGRKGYAGLLVQITDIGVTARWDQDKLIALVARLSTGEPQAHAAVSIIDGRGATLTKGQTDSRGVLELPLKPWRYREARFLLAKVGGETGSLRLTRSGTAPRSPRDLQSFIYTDKAPYKPGETAHINGLLRRRDNSREGGVLPLGEKVALNWMLRSSRRHEIAKGELIVEKGGAFHLDVLLPEDMDLGPAIFSAKIKGSEMSGKTVRHRFQVQHFRAPEFEVSASLSPIAAGKSGALRVPVALVFGQEVALQAKGRYYFGASMQGASLHWKLRRSEGSFRPPKHDGWHFGVTYPWWRSRPSSKIVAQGDGVLDAQGSWRTQHLLDPGKDDSHEGREKIEGAGAYQLEVTVRDESRQRISARAHAVVHPSLTWPGLKVDRAVVEAGQEVQVSAVAVDVKGKREARAVELNLYRLDVSKVSSGLQIKNKRGRRGRRARHWRPRVWKTTRVKVASCVTSAPDLKDLDVDGRLKPVSCTFRPPKAGGYVVQARTKDDAGRQGLSELSLNVFGAAPVRWRVHDEGEVELIADQRSYLPGQTATVLIKSPYPRAHGLLSVERGGVISWRVLDLKSSAAAEKIVLPGRWVPGAHVSVTLFRGRLSSSGDREAIESKPATAHGQLKLPIDRVNKRIDVRIEPASSTLVPGADLSLDVHTTDGQGKPVAANVTIFAVDEGVLALLGFDTPAPLRRFHVERPPRGVGADLRSSILVERFERLRGAQNIITKKAPRMRRASFGVGAAPPPPRAMSSRVKGGPVLPSPEEPEAGDVGGSGPAPRLRALFASTAFFRAAQRSSNEGLLKMKVKLPDNTTTFRIMAVVDDGVDRFGHGQGQVTTRQPVLLRPALPRFASVDDDFDAAVVVHNQTGRAADLLVGARATGVSWHDAFEKTVHLKDNEAREVSFRVQAKTPGRATFQFAARVKGSKLASETDAVQRSIPVNLPATLEAFATYGSTTSSVRQPIVPPTDVMVGFGGLNIALSSTALGGLEDAARYLVVYPYECAEQTASRLIPIASLGTILEQFQIGEVKERAQREVLAERAVKRLLELQHWDGGFKFWSGSRKSSRWITPWVTLSLLLARREGIAVPRAPLEKANRYMRARLRSGWPKDRIWWRSADALALWVLTHPVNDVSGGARDKGLRTFVHRLYLLRRHLPVFSQLWVMTAAHRLDQIKDRDMILADLEKRIVEKAGTAHIAEAVSEDLRLLMHSSDRTDAIAVGALLEVQPKHPLLPKLFKGLMDARIKGRWSTTQANAWALITAKAYFDRFEKVTPRFATSLWLSHGGFLGSARFSGRSLATSTVSVPMAKVLEQSARSKASGGLVDLILSRKGQGRMYYRIGMRYAPKDLKLPATERGFTVHRSYRALRDEDADQVARLPDGSWRVAVGAEIRVDLTVVVPTRAHYVVVDDPLPAGFEPVNPAFHTSERLRSSGAKVRHGGFRWYRWWTWNHKEMRDDRVLLFADRLWAGVYSHSYLARATTPGHFIAGPARAEEMYAPESFGRSATASVEIVR